MKGMEQVLEAPADIVVETQVKNCSEFLKP